MPFRALLYLTLPLSWSQNYQVEWEYVDKPLVLGALRLF